MGIVKFGHHEGEPDWHDHSEPRRPRKEPMDLTLGDVLEKAIATGFEEWTVVGLYPSEHKVFIEREGVFETLDLKDGLIKPRVVRHRRAKMVDGYMVWLDP